MKSRLRPVARLLAILLVLTAGCAEDQSEPNLLGNPARGKAALRSYGCGNCHAIPGVKGADGRVGPPLNRIAKRAYLAGVLPNTPDAMERWIRAPEEVDPLTAMPNMGVTEADARDIRAYLYTLE